MRFRRHTEISFSTTSTSKSPDHSLPRTQLPAFFNIPLTPIMSFYPPFQPRLPIPQRLSTSRTRKSLRRISIFPNYRPNLPTSNASCARFRLWRKDFTTREKQLLQIKTLEERIFQQTEEAQQTAKQQCALFALRAKVHKITVACEQLVNDLCPVSSILRVIQHRPAAMISTNSPSIDLHIHARCIAYNANTTFLELESRPSSLFPLTSPPSPTPTSAPSSCSSTPRLLVEISTYFPIDETATLHHGQIEDVTNSCFDGGWCYRALRNSLKTRRPGGRLRIRRRKLTH